MDSLLDQQTESSGGITSSHIGGSVITGQSVYIGMDFIPTSLAFSLQRFGSPTGNVFAQIYKVEQGTHGVDARPLSSPLATSSPINVTSISTSVSEVTFDFLEVPILTGNRFVVAFDMTDTVSDINNRVNVRGATLSGRHKGNHSVYTISTGLWTVPSLNPDLYFKLYGDATEYGVLLKRKIRPLSLK